MKKDTPAESDCDELLSGLLIEELLNAENKVPWNKKKRREKFLKGCSQ